MRSAAITNQLLSAFAAAMLLAGVVPLSTARASEIGETCKLHHLCPRSADPGPKEIVRDHRADGGYYSPTYPIVRDHPNHSVHNDGRPHR